jgi:hypothetical protein
MLLVLQQVDDFLIAGPTRDECESMHCHLQEKLVTNPALNDLGIIKLFNGLDIDQTVDYYIKVSCQSYIRKIVEHHGWSKERTKDLPVPMQNDSETLGRIQTEQGPTETKEKEALEQMIGFSYSQGFGELIFAMSTCRVDIAASVIFLSQHSEQPAKIQYRAKNTDILRSTQNTDGQHSLDLLHLQNFQSHYSTRRNKLDILSVRGGVGDRP